MGQMAANDHDSDLIKVQGIYHRRYTDGNELIIIVDYSLRPTKNIILRLKKIPQKMQF